MGDGSVCVNIVSPHPGSRNVFLDLVVGLPAILFLVFLAWRVKPSLRKLRRSQSHIMTTYYGFLWVVTLLNVLRCFVQVAASEATHPVLWNLLWMLTRFGLVMLEVSVVVFLLQGYLTSGREALLRTLWISGGLALFETLVTLLYVFAFHVPLFLYGGGDGQEGHRGVDDDRRWSKWGFWLAHTLVFLLVYTGILILPHTKWRDRLPAKPSFYRYVLILFVLNLVAALGTILLASHVAGGYCIYGLAAFLYYAIYPPLLYLTFLAEFFLDDELDDELYYSEMKEAGYFEDYDDGL
ncbi:hypothetical protein WJX72_005332 [[Myrmecia] bisecta]|uniref:Transmembrane protein adipocyte-associated 1 n=1 Tax=[Myrmecia] bisecta TaxID=41462 RepID=A0AAW1Q6P2_9CHLO